jgi:hypothetical protein
MDLAEVLVVERAVKLGLEEPAALELQTKVTLEEVYPEMQPHQIKRVVGVVAVLALLLQMQLQQQQELLVVLVLPLLLLAHP